MTLSSGPGIAAVGGQRDWGEIPISVKAASRVLSELGPLGSLKAQCFILGLPLRFLPSFDSILVSKARL